MRSYRNRAKTPHSRQSVTLPTKRSPSSPTIPGSWCRTSFCTALPRLEGRVDSAFLPESITKTACHQELSRRSVQCPRLSQPTRCHLIPVQLRPSLPVLSAVARHSERTGVLY